MSRDFWNHRYSTDELVYGACPNDFLLQMADRLATGGSAIDLGAGEGRNALFLASRGLAVLAVDQSETGLAKARRRAEALGLPLRTQAADLQHFDADRGSVDVVTSLFVHLPQRLRETVHRRVASWLRPGGMFLLEAYAPDQIGRGTGGPDDVALLASLETIQRELDGLEFEHAASLVRDVSEGLTHTGEASVVQILARKR
jgi:SAM-dependent methyltransferase